MKLSAMKMSTTAISPSYFASFIETLCRSAENQRCLVTRDPGHPDLASLATVAGAGGRRLIVGGWWRLVRLSFYNIRTYPYYNVYR